MLFLKAVQVFYFLHCVLYSFKGLCRSGFCTAPFYIDLIQAVPLFRLGLLIKVRCHSYGCAEGSFSVLVLVDYRYIGMAVSQCCVLLEAVLQCCVLLDLLVCNAVLLCCASL